MKITRHKQIIETKKINSLKRNWTYLYFRLIRIWLYDEVYIDLKSINELILNST